MTRTARAALIVLLVVLAAAACTSSSSSKPRSTTTSAPLPPTDPDRPNIVFIVADDLTPDLLQYLPHVRQMQRRGLTMDNFFATTSLGGPARASLLTGRYAHNTGVITNGGANGGYATFTAKSDAKNSFVLGVRRAGYTTGLIGEYLTGYRPTDAAPPGWDRWAVSDDAYAGYDYTMRLNDTPHRFGKSASDYATDVIADRASYFIRTTSAAGSPFFLQLASFAPHLPAVASSRDTNALPTATYPHNRAFDQAPAHPVSWLRFGPLSAAALATIDAQYRARVRSVLALDVLIGRVEKALSDAGVADNTYLVFTSANGYHLGEYRLPAGKQTAFDTDIRVPLVVTGPGVRVNKHAAQFGSTIDLAPTFARLISAQLPAASDGVSLDAVWHGSLVDAGAQAVLIEHKRGQAFAGDPDPTEPRVADPPDYAAVRTPDALYVRYATGEKEYYDLVNDPFELDNLAATQPVPMPLQRSLAALVACHGEKKCQAAALIATG